MLWLLAVKKKKSFLLLLLLSKHQLQHQLQLLTLLQLQPLLLLTLLLLLQPLLLPMLLLHQLSNFRFHLTLFVKKPTFGLAFFLSSNIDPVKTLFLTGNHDIGRMSCQRRRQGIARQFRRVIAFAEMRTHHRFQPYLVQQRQDLARNLVR